MKLPPSIIQRRILVEKPNDYGCYMYKFIDTKHKLKAFYLGIKKDKLSAKAYILFTLLPLIFTANLQQA